MNFTRLGIGIVALLVGEFIGRIGYQISTVLPPKGFALISLFSICCIAFCVWSLADYPTLDFRSNRSLQVLVICSFFGLVIGVASNVQS